MFLGQYRHRVDEKMRVALPARFREEFRNGAVVTRGPDRCLWVFTQEKWAQLAANFEEDVKMSTKDGRLASRFFFSSASDDLPDQQGRIRLPDHLSQYAGIEPKSEVVVVGLNSRVEIWSAQRWEEQEALMEQDPEGLIERISSLGRL
ncbi:MAG: division/cell wall cluster transcriptional repressor MraZ [Anaerolineae bacterium]|nr:division/cell wall cluster transcriptional repressor MraZ [Anaerolineae bacterium]